MPRPLPQNPARSDSAALFVYRQRFRFPAETSEIMRIGIMGVLHTESTHILPHEETIPERVAAMRRSLSDRLYDPGPLWLWCNDPDDSLASAIQPAGPPQIIAQDHIGCIHEYWRINELNELHRIKTLQVALGGRLLFLADGHHRYAAGWKFGVIQIRTSA